MSLLLHRQLSDVYNMRIFHSILLIVFGRNESSFEWLEGEAEYVLLFFITIFWCDRMSRVILLHKNYFVHCERQWCCFAQIEIKTKANFRLFISDFVHYMFCAYQFSVIFIHRLLCWTKRYQKTRTENNSHVCIARNCLFYFIEREMVISLYTLIGIRFG